MKLQSFYLTKSGEKLLASILQAGAANDPEGRKPIFANVLLSDASYTTAQIKAFDGVELPAVWAMLPITKALIVDNSTVQIEAAFDNRDLSETSMLRTVALSAATPDNTIITFAMAAVEGGETVPAFADSGVDYGLTFKIEIKLDEAEAFEVKVDPNGYATVRDARALRKAIKTLTNAVLTGTLTAETAESITSEMLDITGDDNDDINVLQPVIDKTLTQHGAAADAYETRRYVDLSVANALRFRGDYLLELADKNNEVHMLPMGAYSVTIDGAKAQTYDLPGHGNTEREGVLLVGTGENVYTITQIYMGIENGVSVGMWHRVCHAEELSSGIVPVWSEWSRGIADTDTMLTTAGMPADAAAVGVKIADIVHTLENMQAGSGATLNWDDLSDIQKTNLLNTIGAAMGTLDATLTRKGKPADAKAVGDALAAKASMVYVASALAGKMSVVEANRLFAGKADLQDYEAYKENVGSILFDMNDMMQQEAEKLTNARNRLKAVEDHFADATTADIDLFDWE